MIAKYGKFEYALAEHYRFEDELGRGAMGTVYRARDMRLGRAVAIKMLHPMLTNELGIARFQSEIRIAAGLHHPNIIGVHDSGEADGRLYFVMDYLGGETLRDRLLREKQLSVEESLTIIEQVAAGLQYAHDHGVVHRDVKPENIILAEGRACMMDFGLARALGGVDTQRLTASGMAVGTPHYLSPEQASGEREVGPRSDQYALACVLYEMLAGEPPITGPTATSIATRQVTEVPQPLRRKRHTTPQAVEAAVMRALEKVPGDRFASIAGLVQALHAPPPPPVVPEGELPKRWKVLTASIGVVLLVVTAIIGVAFARSDGGGLSSIDNALRSIAGRGLDTTRFVVLPLAPGSGATPPIDVPQRLSAAIARWSDVSVPSAAEVREAAAARATFPVTAATGAYIARKLGAARFVLLDISTISGRLAIHADLHEVGRAFGQVARVLS